MSHLRVDGGRYEIDLIVEFDDRVLALEVKLSALVDDRDVRHLRWLRGQFGERLVDAPARPPWRARESGG